MSNFVCQQSPIPWPSSKKKSRLKISTPSGVAVREANKLSSKKKKNKALPEPQITTATPKQLLLRKKSVETFHRIYNEMFNDFSENDSCNGSPSSFPERPLFRQSSPSSTNFKATPSRSVFDIGCKSTTIKSSSVVADVERTDRRSNAVSLRAIENLPSHRNSSENGSKQSIASEVIVIDSDSSCSGSNSAFGSPIAIGSLRVTGDTFKTPQSTKMGGIVFETSSDDDESISILPLHQRILMTPNSAPGKIGTTNGRKTFEPKLDLDDSSDLENSPVIKTRTRRKLGKPTVLFDDSSSDDELPDLPKPSLPTTSLFTKKTPRHQTTTFGKKATIDDSLFDELPDLPKPSLPTTPFFTKKTSFPDPPRPTLPRHQTTTTFGNSATIDDDELPDLPRPAKPTSKNSKTPTTSEKRIVLTDDSSSDELIDFPRPVKPTKTQTFAKVQNSDKCLPGYSPVGAASPAVPRCKPFLTVPRKLNHQATTTGSDSAGSPTCLNLWPSKESLSESSKFLKSLSESSPVDPVSSQFRKQFSKHKDELVKKLYATFNQTVFENKLPAEMNITWNIRLTKTAGYCYMKSHSDKRRTARIELSTKVLDNTERVRDTLLHEMCHAAAFVVHGYRDGHGPIFQHWGKKACFLFPYLPVVSRCHNYKINTKYVYKCIKCFSTIGRHSKSLDTNRKGCGRCGGRFELLVNGVSKTPGNKKTPEFAKFVKLNYKLCKEANQNLKHAEIMNKLGKDFACKATI